MFILPLRQAALAVCLFSASVINLFQLHTDLGQIALGWHWTGSYAVCHNAASFTVQNSWNLLNQSWNYYKRNLFLACAQAFFFVVFFQWTVSCVFVCGQLLKMSSQVNLETSWSSFSTAERPMEIMKHRNRWAKSVETPSQQSFFSSWFILIIDLLYRAYFLSACHTAKKI